MQIKPLALEKVLGVASYSFCADFFSVIDLYGRHESTETFKISRL